MKKKSFQKLNFNKKAIVSLSNRVLLKVKGGTRTGDDDPMGESGLATACDPVHCY